MANGFGSLGSAYATLGQATTSEYNRRKKEEDDARKTARREARQDRMLNYFTAPLLQSAGKALTEGVTDLISGPIEEKYSEFFNSESYRAAKVQERQAN